MRGDGPSGLPALPVAYRGYTIQFRRGSFHIRHSGETISMVPSVEKAKAVIDEWMEPK